jgi:hypothetical protein
MKQLVEGTSLELSSWILNRELWTQLEQDLLVNSSDLITLFSDRQVPETIGPKVTILKVLNSSTQSLMSSEKKLKDAIAFRDFKSLIPLVVVQDLGWELF